MTHATGSLLLHFAPGAESGDELRGQLSAVVQTGAHLWLASDESNSIERLSRTGAGEYARHEMFSLADCLDLPGGEEEEIDIEGMDFDGGYLWIVGSHGLKRRKAKPGGNPAKQIALEVAGDGAPAPATRCQAGGEERTAARLMGSDRGNLLTEVLRLDEHLAPFLAIPSKDNGFDVEGIAVRGDRVFLGLRGPVLRGWAMILELSLADAGAGLLRLEPLEGRRPYRKHFLDLRGLGVRDLCLHRSDLLILAGPTMDLDGPAAVYRWRDALDADGDTLVARDELEEVVEVPYGTGEYDAADHPEGLSTYAADGGKPDHLLVVYDSPDARRLHGESGVRADLFPLGK
jgi:hypothetical protein